jgi:type IV secretory pathway TrbL component
MNGLIVQAIIVCALAIAAWWVTERFAPDPLLAKLVKLLIFIGVLVWVIVKLIPRIM